MVINKKSCNIYMWQTSVSDEPDSGATARDSQPDAPILRHQPPTTDARSVRRGNRRDPPAWTRPVWAELLWAARWPPPGTETLCRSRIWPMRSPTSQRPRDASPSSYTDASLLNLQVLKWSAATIWFGSHINSPNTVAMDTWWWRSSRSADQRVRTLIFPQRALLFYK